ncbi:MAG: hypothetical protein ACR2NN_27425 [Bryobacteraceae bacterium]
MSSERQRHGGGARIIYVYFVGAAHIYLLRCYAKKDAAADRG